MIPTPQHQTQELNLQKRKYVEQTTRILATRPVKPLQEVRVNLNDLPLRKTIKDLMQHADSLCPHLYGMFEQHDYFELYVYPEPPAQELVITSTKVNHKLWADLDITRFYTLALPVYQHSRNGHLHFMYYSPDHVFGDNGQPIRYSHYDNLDKGVITLPAIDICGNKFQFHPQNKPHIYRAALWLDHFIRQHYMNKSITFGGASYDALMARRVDVR